MQWRAALRKRDRCQWFWRRARAAEWGSLLRSCLSCDGPEVRILSPPPHAPVAQRIEHLTTDQKVRGSNPFGRTSSDPYLVGAGLLYLLPGSAAQAEALRGGALRSFTCGQGSVTYRWFLVTCRWFCATYARAVGATCALVDALFTCGQAIANRWVNYASIRQRTSSLASATRSNR